MGSSNSKDSSATVLATGDGQQLSEQEFLEPSMFRVVSSENDDGDNSVQQSQQQREQQQDDKPHRNYRILALEGDSGCVFCRVHGDMQKTIPRLSENGGTLEFATRTLLRMKNITVARQLGRNRSMMGPLDYLANLDEPDKNLFTIDLPMSHWPQSERFPKFKFHPSPVPPALPSAAQTPERNREQHQASSPSCSSSESRKRKVTLDDVVVVDATWFSGKKFPEVVQRVVEEEYKKKFGIKRVFGYSVFPNPGILECTLVSDARTRRTLQQQQQEEEEDEQENKEKEKFEKEEINSCDTTTKTKTVFDFPVVDATELDLCGSGFNCRVVRNNVPFRFTTVTDATTGQEGAKGKEEEGLLPPSQWPRPVTYNFQPKYAHESVYGVDAAGLFLETHDFTQTMTPANPDDSVGFIVVGKWADDDDGQDSENDCGVSTLPSHTHNSNNSNNNNNRNGNGKVDFDPTPRRLHLVALRIPYGWTIIVDKQCIHGDTTFSGLYVMAMTTDHVVMASADTVFLKNAKTKKNIDFSCPKHFEVVNRTTNNKNSGTSPSASPSASSSSCDPYPVRVREGIVVYKDATLEELQSFDRDTKGASFILQPFSKLSWTTTFFRRFGWYPGMPSKS